MATNLTFLGYAGFYYPDSSNALVLPLYEISSLSAGYMLDCIFDTVEPFNKCGWFTSAISDYFNQFRPITSSGQINKNNSLFSPGDQYVLAISPYGSGDSFTFSILDSTGSRYEWWGSLNISYENSDTRFFIIKYSNRYYPGTVNTSDYTKCFSSNSRPSGKFASVTSIKILSSPNFSVPANFYRSSSPGVIDSSAIELARGESSSQLEYTVVYEDGSYEAYTGEVSYTGDGLGTAYTIENNVITVAEMTSRPSAVITAKPTAYGEDTELFTFINLTITNPNGVYDEGNSDINAPGLGPGGVGGNGSFGKNEVSDPITVPNGSVAGDASATGMMTRYIANSSYLEIFGDWLWTTDLGLTIAKSAISLIYGDPAESVISVMSYPFDIRSLSGVTTRNQNLYWGNHNSGLPFIALTSAAATVDWGTISLSEYWGNFLDYEPHTKIELYLPWGTGFVPIDPGQCLPGTLRVVTNIDLNKGSCIHNVFGNNNCVIGSYAGQCSQQIPTMSNDYASKIAGVVTAAAGIATAGASGAISAGKSAGAAFDRYVSDNPIPASGVPVDWKSGLDASVRSSATGGFKTGARSGANLAANSSVAAARRTGGVSRNGAFTDGSAALGCQYPYIILSRPTQSVPKEYGSHYGYPSNITASLGNLKGYTEVGEIHINGIDATGPELSELDHILKGGVIF